MSEDDRRRWEGRYARATGPGEPSATLVRLAGWLPGSGRALDVAGGSGRHALWLARLGLDVTLADISTVALRLARDAADRAGVRLATMARDIEAEGLPPGPWGLVACIDFLWRPMFAELPRVLAPGGRFAMIHPTRSNLLRHERPSPRFLLDDGELPGLVAGLEILHHAEGWTATGRHEAFLVARRGAGG